MTDTDRNRKIPDLVKLARKVSTPIVAISTADQWATMAAIAESFENRPPIIQWDCARGLLPVNNEGKAALKQVMPKDDDAIPGIVPGTNLVEALGLAANLPPKSLLFLLNAHRFFQEPAVIQSILNIREQFKENARTLALLGAIIQLPIELQQDVMTFDEQLPGEDQLEAVIRREVKAAREATKDIPDPDAETVRHAVEALSGLALFPAEQSVAMSIAACRRLDVDQLWDRKRAFVRQTRGLKFDTGGTTFDNIGGLDFIKKAARSLFAGKRPPRAIIRIDEIEKHMAGASGVIADSSGVSQDALGVILREMEDNRWRGMIAVGPPGSGKSLFTQSLGRTYGVPTLELDLGALKGSLVGQSEENIRNAMKVIKAIAGLGAYWVATCNKLDVLPPELRRRFQRGIWFFDLPTAEELRPIWRMHLDRCGLPDDIEECLKVSTVAGESWTGAEVRNICDLAEENGEPVLDLLDQIIPVSVSDPDSIERLRKLAAGKFLSASVPGKYVHPADRGTVAGPTTRRAFMES